MVAVAVAGVGVAWVVVVATEPAAVVAVAVVAPIPDELRVAVARYHTVPDSDCSFSISMNPMGPDYQLA